MPLGEGVPLDEVVPLVKLCEEWSWVEGSNLSLTRGGMGWERLFSVTGILI